MKKLDCPQCGAAITDEKCPYCGAVFYDFSTITLNEPCYIKVRVRTGDKYAIIRTRVLPEVMTLTCVPSYSTFEDYTGSEYRKIDHVSGDIEMRFTMLSDMNSGELYTVEEVRNEPT